MSTYWSPRSSEAQHVKQQECDTNPAGCTVGWPVAGEFADQDSDNKMRQCHEEATPKQQWPSSKPIHRPKTSEYSDELSDIEDAGHDQLETIVQTHGFEQGGRVVNQSVYADKSEGDFRVSLTFSWRYSES